MLEFNLSADSSSPVSLEWKERDFWLKLKQTQVKLNQVKDQYGSLPPKVRYEVMKNTDPYFAVMSHARRQRAEGVSRAWVKLHEILCHSHCLEALVGRIPSPPQGRKTLSVFCNAELPGSFVTCLHHYVQTKFPSGIELKWCASSLHSTEALGDTYGLWSHYREKWCQDDKMNGDVTKVENLLSIQKWLHERGHKTWFYTSDAGFEVSDPNQQEAQTSLLHYGSTFLGLSNLEKHGSMLIKQFTFASPASIYLLFFLRQKFDKVTFLKPASSRPSNSEIYVLAENYQGKIQTTEARFFSQLLQTCQMRSTTPYQLQAECFPWQLTPSFCQSILTISNSLTQNQMDALQFLLDYKHHDQEVIEESRRQMTREFLLKYPILKLRFRLLPHTNKTKITVGQTNELEVTSCKKRKWLAS